MFVVRLTRPARQSVEPTWGYFLVDTDGSSGDWVKITYEGQDGFIF